MKAEYPLKIDGTNSDGDIEIVADDMGKCLVATVDAENCDSPDSAMRDAQRIVKSWNCHDELVESGDDVLAIIEQLQSVLGSKMIEASSLSPLAYCGAIRRFREAITVAKGAKQ